MKRKEFIKSLIAIPAAVTIAKNVAKAEPNPNEPKLSELEGLLNSVEPARTSDIAYIKQSTPYGDVYRYNFKGYEVALFLRVDTEKQVYEVETHIGTNKGTWCSFSKISKQTMEDEAALRWVLQISADGAIRTCKRDNKSVKPYQKRPKNIKDA